MLIGLLVLIAAGIAVYLAVGKGRSGGSSDGSVTPVDILRKRYARGELSREEYHQALEDLK